MFWLISLIILIICIFLSYKVSIPDWGEIICGIGALVFGVIAAALIVGGLTINASKYNEEKELESLYNEANLLLELNEYISESHSFSIAYPDFNQLGFTNNVINAVEEYNKRYNYLYDQDNSTCYGSLINMDFLDNYKPILIETKEISIIVK